MRRLAILSSHPIQYNAPLFRALNQQDHIQIQVFFSKTWEQVKIDREFGQEIKWDIPVDQGYPHETPSAMSKRGRASLITAIAQFDPNAILVYGWNLPGHFSVLRHFKGKTQVWFRGDSHLLDAIHPIKSIVRKIWLQYIYKHIDLAFSVGIANEHYYRWCGLSPAQIIRAPHAIENERFHNPQTIEDAKALRDALDIPLESKVVLFAGKFIPKKNPELVIQAWQDLPQDNVYLILAGSGLLEEKLKRLCASHPRVRFTGFVNQSQMPGLYASADVLCMPSLGPGETWGLAVNEAIASGTPCIVSDKAGCALDFIDSTWVRVLPPHGRAIWSQALVEILKEKSPSAKWHEQFLSTFAHQKMVTALIKHIHNE